MKKIITTLVATAAVVFGGLAVAAPASATSDPIAESASAEAAAASSYSVDGGWALVEQWGMDFPYEITGGVLHEDGTGVIHLHGTHDIVVTSWMLNPFFGGFMSFTYGGAYYYGELEPLGPNMYEGDFESVFGDLEFMPIQLTPIT